MAAWGAGCEAVAGEAVAGAGGWGTGAPGRAFSCNCAWRDAAASATTSGRAQVNRKSVRRVLLIAVTGLILLNLYWNSQKLLRETISARARVEPRSACFLDSGDG